MHNEKEPQVSVIMACHNSSNYLSESIESILNQTFKDFELIIVDDFSTDNTLSMLESYQKQDTRITVLALKKNMGPATARNTGVNIAKGNWLAIIDSDDVASSLRIEEQMKLATADKDLVLIGSNADMIDQQGNLIESCRYPTNHDQLIDRLYAIKGFPPHSSIVYRADAFTQLLGFNHRFTLGQDRDLCIRMSEIGKVGSVNQSLAKIRKHNQNISLADNGERSLTFALTSCVCHFIRIKGYCAPSENPDDGVWNIFIEWIKDKAIEKGFFTRRKALIESTLKYYSAQNRLIGAWESMNYLLSENIIAAVIKEKFTHSNLSENLAQEWIKLKE